MFRPCELPIRHVLAFSSSVSSANSNFSALHVIIKVYFNAICISGHLVVRRSWCVLAYEIQLRLAHTDLHVISDWYVHSDIRWVTYLGSKSMHLNPIYSSKFSFNNPDQYYGSLYKCTVTSVSVSISRYIYVEGKINCQVCMMQF